MHNAQQCDESKISLKLIEFYFILLKMCVISINKYHYSRADKLNTREKTLAMQKEILKANLFVSANDGIAGIVKWIEKRQRSE